MSSYSYEKQRSPEPRTHSGSGLTGPSPSLDLEKPPLNHLKDTKKGLYSKVFLDGKTEGEFLKDYVVLPSTNHRLNYFKPMGVRNPGNFADRQIIPNHSFNNNSINRSSQDQDNLVAMGTNWNVPQSNGRSGRPGSIGNGSSGLFYSASSSNTSGSIGPMIGAFGSKRIGSKASIMGGHQAVLGSIGRQGKDNEPKYGDPTVGAPPGLQHRIAEIATLESETIRWEKTRKIKKKPKDV